MSAPIPWEEPVNLRAGVNWSWHRSLSDYPADLWTLRYWLKNATSHIEIAALPDGTDHLVSVAATVTAAYQAGEYQWIATVESGVDKHEVATGRMVIAARADTAEAADLRSVARRMVEQLEAAQADYLSNGRGMVQQYTIADRSVTFSSAKEFTDALEYWRQRLATEDAQLAIESGKGNPRRFYGRFSR